MQTTLLSTLAAAALLVIGSQPARAEPTGTWMTEGGRATVRIAKCGGAICGSIVSLKEPNDPQTGRPKTDKNNADPGKRSRPMIGVPIVLSMRPNGTNKWSGQVYNAEDGKTYSGHVTLTGDRTLKLEGCVASVFCKSQNWTRAN
jgi:uncharacterized protein (DUF2147 family)